MFKSSATDYVLDNDTVATPLILRVSLGVACDTPCDALKELMRDKKLIRSAHERF